MMVTFLNDDNIEENNKYKLIPVDLPEDKELFYERPFFAYGIFKQGQLAHSKIDNCIEEILPDSVPRKLYIRDGLPVITDEDEDSVSAKGDKFYFLEDKIKDAYKIICDTQPGNIYRWDTIDIDDEPFNILVTDDIEGTFENADDDGNYVDDFNGLDDPFFSKVPKFIRNELEHIDYDDENTIFKMQMYYMLLWSAIDRYCSLKYDVSNTQADYLKNLSDDELFIQAFYSIKPDSRDPVRSANNASTFYFNRARPNFVVNYYYTIRSNVVHRGKEVRNNIGRLRDSLYDLLDIFCEMIKITFNVQG